MSLRLRVVRALDLSPSELSLWSSLQAANPQLASPFFRPEFTRAIAQAQSEVYVGILESRRGIDGFFPYQIARKGFGLPVGSKLSDYHGVICPESLEFDPRHLIAGCGLRHWKFDHVPASQRAFEPYAGSRSLSPQINLSKGYASFVEERPQAGARPFRRLNDLRRQLAREIGPLRFAIASQHKPDLAAVLRLKAEQYDRTRSAPLFEEAGVREAIDALWATQGPAFAPMLSTLHAGDDLVAAHFGLRTETTLHWWFPVYDPRHARYSPGLLLLLSIIQEANGIGIVTIDLGQGDERYKNRFANGGAEVLRGRIDLPDTIGQRLRSSVFAVTDRIRRPRTTSNPSLTPALSELRKTWDTFGATDPLWAICMRPDRKYETWDIEEFFASGETELAADIRHIESLGARLNLKSALDFGCGIGRITRCLADRFDRVTGVDVSPRLIAEAKRWDNTSRRAVYLEQTSEDLSAFGDGSFDFIYCCNVLQTMPAELGMSYLREFMRVVSPGGIVFFQVPIEFRDLPFELPADAFRADITCAVTVPLESGRATTIPVTVTNASRRRWPASFCDGRSQDLNVGNHWLNATGEWVAGDDGRAHIPKPLRPGESVTVPLVVTPPSSPGAYVLQIDLVVERVAWFASRGSQVCSVPIDVVAAAPVELAMQAEDEHSALMATNTIPRSAIEEIMTQGGGTILDATEDKRAGLVWRSFRFTVVKALR